MRSSNIIDTGGDQYGINTSTFIKSFLCRGIFLFSAGQKVPYSVSSRSEILDSDRRVELMLVFVLMRRLELAFLIRWIRWI
jgi:hypothetical protein